LQAGFGYARVVLPKEHYHKNLSKGCVIK